MNKLIENIRQDIKIENFDTLKLSINELKEAMKDMVDTKPLVDNEGDADPMSNLNDL